MKFGTMLAVCGVCAAMSAAATAASELLIDVNGLTAQATTSSGGAGFGGLTHTGSISLFNDPNSVLAGVGIDGVNQATTPGLGMTFSGVINLVNGVVSGGSISVSMSDGSAYMAVIQGGIGQIALQAGQGFQIDGLTFNGFFSDSGAPGMINKFAGVNITPWALSEPLFGSLLNFAFQPNTNGRDTDADIDIFVTAVIPAPVAAMAGAAGLLGVASVRRRRR